MFIFLIIVMYSGDDKSTSGATCATSKDPTYVPSEDSSKSSKYRYVSVCVPEGINNNVVIISQHEYYLLYTGEMLSVYLSALFGTHVAPRFLHLSMPDLLILKCKAPENSEFVFKSF